MEVDDVKAAMKCVTGRLHRAQIADRGGRRVRECKLVDLVKTDCRRNGNGVYEAGSEDVWPDTWPRCHSARSSCEVVLRGSMRCAAV